MVSYVKKLFKGDIKMKTSDSESWRRFAKALGEKDYSRISQYAQEQARNILFEFINGDPKINAKLDSMERLLNYYKSSIDKKRELNIYELAKLEGYIKCLQSIALDNMLNEEAMEVYNKVKEYLTKELEKNAKKIILLLYDSGSKFQSELKDAIKLEQFEFNRVVSVLKIYGLISNYQEEDYYTLTDTGTRVAKQLKKQK